MIAVPDLFSSLPAPLPAALEYGLNDFARGPPLWPIGPGAWQAIVEDVRRFANRWHRAAIRQGWTTDELYGLHGQAPYARLDAMGAAWIVAWRRDQVIGLDAKAITLKTRSPATLKIYRKGTS